MPDVGMEFALLTQAARAENQLATRTLDTQVSAGPLMVAIDPQGKRHLLVPLVDEENVVQDTRSRGVWLKEALLGPPNDLKRFADLECREPSLDLVFERLVEDVVSRLAAAETPGRALHTALDDWRAMLRASRNIGREEIIGLIGELEVLRKLGRSSPSAALGAWTGPRKTVHDFVRGEAAIEVKTTSAVDGAAVSINGLDQVDPHDVGALHLAVVHCQADPSAPTLDDRVRRLLRAGFPRDELLAGILRTGYMFESETGEPTTYRVKSLRIWAVTDSFPGLRRSTLPEKLRKGVTQVRYTLSLDAAEACMPEEAAHEFLEGWVAR